MIQHGRGTGVSAATVTRWTSAPVRDVLQRVNLELPMSRLSIPKADLPALTHLAELGGDILVSVSEDLEKPGDPEALSGWLIENEKLGPVGGLLRTLALVGRKLGLTADTLTAEFVDAAAESSVLSEEQLRRLRELTPQLRRILGSVPLESYAKSVDLITDRGASVRRVRVITETRPIFRESDVLGVLILETLRIDVADERGRTRTLEMHLTADSLRELREHCARAELKHDTLRATLTGAGLKVFNEAEGAVE